MKDEIKEILEDNGELMVRYKNNSFECFDTLPKNVLDYITNLQEENKHLDKVNCHLRKKINNDVYKSRIEKAIEYVEKSMNNTHPFYEYLCGDENGEVENLDKLLNMLNGDE